MPFSPLWILPGAMLIVVALYDFYTTTMTLQGGGPISRNLPHWLWVSCLRAQRVVGRGQLLSAAGPVIMLMMILVWFGLCWLGWWMIFCGNEALIVNAQTQAPADWVERLYYAGYTLTTVGYGDFMAATPAARIASIVAGFNGLFLVTMAITYSIPVLSATAERRQLSLLINMLGQSTEDMVNKNYGEGSFSFLAAQLQQLTGQIAGVSQQQLAYPVLHYFHDTRAANALPLNIARLREAVTVILFAFPHLPHATRAQLETTQRVIDHFLENVKPAFASKNRNGAVPVGPAYARIFVLKNSARKPGEIDAFVRAQLRRKLLLDYIESDGWSWDDVHCAERA